MPQFSQSLTVVTLDNYRLARAEAGIKTVPRLPSITPPPVSKIDAGLDWAKSALDQISEEQAKALSEIEAQILERVQVSMQKAMLDEARETTVLVVEGDDQALGYRRVPRPDACYWCIEQALRKTSRKGLAKDFKRYGSPGVSLGGDEHWGVYKSRESAGQIPPNEAGEINRFHNKCHCEVEPIFSTDFAIPAWLQDMAVLYDDSDGTNDFRRRLNAQRNGEPAPDPTPVLPTPTIQPAAASAYADLLARLNAQMAA
ncbi:hypothetical protein EFK50_07820 [Nocardioides marmoriginsengisoli]|uniref:Uncharacterized protein n=1 Tax=Nocardioides marmoriginsengisoli TaxID=661483 RepID=A0A3N0CK38_9ACTN|nr:hypothetical protein EFK50_07820 [Nocardioides marmoriginsengisoli]